MDPFVALVRRWAVEWLAGRDPSACEEILAPSYTLLIGGFRLGPRDEYVKATLEQLDRFPGLGVTVHDLIAGHDGVALRFTEHGASARLDGRTAAWRGVALFGWDGHRLTECFAEEDYLARRRQLDADACDPIDPPAAAPWNVSRRPADPAAEAAVRAWLDDGKLEGVRLDDGTGGPSVEPASTEVNRLFSSGSRVAFHATRHGAAAEGELASLHLAGIVDVEAGGVVAGHVVRDRLGLRRALAAERTV